MHHSSGGAGSIKQKGNIVFRVEFYVDDKRLGNALLALVGLAHGQPSVTPVVNAVKKGNGLDAVVKSGSSVERFAELLKSHKGEVLIARDVGKLMKPMGMSLSSKGYMLKQAVKTGLLKKSGKGSGMKYTVTVS
jgi:hypothetical protein